MPVYIEVWHIQMAPTSTPAERRGFAVDQVLRGALTGVCRKELLKIQYEFMTIASTAMVLSLKGRLA
jgi:hypothetical protein